MTRSAEIEAALQGIRHSSHPRELRELVQGATDEMLQFRSGPDEWSVVEILRHLGDVEEMRHMRLDRMLAEENPLLQRAVPQPGERDSQDAAVLLDRWERLRTRALERLERMSEEQWRRIGTQAPDPHVGRVVPFVTDTLDQALRINEHSGDHLGQIWKNLARFRSRRLTESRSAGIHGHGAGSGARTGS
jgi:DinB family protein